MKNWLKWWTDHKRVIPLTIGAIVLLVISNMTSGSAVSLLCIAGALAMGIAVPLVARAEDRERGGTLTPIENLQTTTSAINALTARWCAAAPPGECALSGVGVWPLLALLEAGASGRALEKLRAATGVDPHEASRAVRRMGHDADNTGGSHRRALPPVPSEPAHPARLNTAKYWASAATTTSA